MASEPPFPDDTTSPVDVPVPEPMDPILPGPTDPVIGVRTIGNLPSMAA